MQIKNRVSGRGNLFAGLIFMRCGSLQIHTAYFLGEYRAESLRSCCFIRGKTHICVAIHCRVCFCPLSLPLYCKRRSSSPPASLIAGGVSCPFPPPLLPFMVRRGITEPPTHASPYHKGRCRTHHIHVAPFGKGRWCVAPEGIRKPNFNKTNRNAVINPQKGRHLLCPFCPCEHWKQGETSRRRERKETGSQPHGGVSPVSVL